MICAALHRKHVAAIRKSEPWKGSKKEDFLDGK